MGQMAQMLPMLMQSGM